MIQNVGTYAHVPTLCITAFTLPQLRWRYHTVPPVELPELAPRSQRSMPRPAPGSGAFRALCHHFRREANPEFFLAPRRNPQTQPKKSAAREKIVALRKQNYSAYEISETLKERGLSLNPTAVREALKAEGFAPPLPRRLDEERPDRPRPTIEAVANVRSFSLAHAGSARVAGSLPVRAGSHPPASGPDCHRGSS